MTLTGSNSQTIILQGDSVTGTFVRLFPCPCGEIHHGEYAHELFIEHICTHDAPLFNSGDDQWMCEECGKVFYLAVPRLDPTAKRHLNQNLWELYE